MTTNTKVENAIAALEAAGIDITSNYAAWRDVGFALISEFGEAAGDYFHRISRLYPKYDHKTCEEQFQRCLKSTGQGIGIGTLFHLIKEAGVDISPSATPAPEKISPKSRGIQPGSGSPQEEAPEGPQEPEEEALPQFPEDMYPLLPEFLQKLVYPASTPQERDMLLLGALAMLSACFPNIHGFYDGKKVMPNLYIFITAKASSGKGILNLLKRWSCPYMGKNARRQNACSRRLHWLLKPGKNRLSNLRRKCCFSPPTAAPPAYSNCCMTITDRG